MLGLLILGYLGYYVYDTYRERTPLELEARVIHLEDQRVSTRQLVPYLESDSAAIRARAALAVGRIGDESSGGLLVPLLADPDIAVATNAAFALGLTGQAEYADDLLDQAWDLPSVVAAKAVESAGRLSDSAATDIIDAIMPFLAHPAPEVREAACYALFHCRARSKGSDLVKLWQVEEDIAIKEAALYAVSRMGLAVGRDIFIEAVADQDPFVRSIALRGLAACKDKDAQQYLLIALNDGNLHVVAQAISGLTQLGGQKAFDACYQKLAHEQDEKLVLDLLTALDQIDVPFKPTEYVRDLLVDSESPYVIAAVAQFVARTEGGRAMGLLDSLVHDHTHPQVLAGCATAYGATRQPNVATRLTKLWLNDDPLVRAAAYEQLIVVDSGNVEYHIDEALNDSDYVVVYGALNTIQAMQKRQYLPVMQTMMTRKTTDVELRRGIIDVAASFLPEENPRQDTAVMQILIAGLLDPNYVVRMGAAEVYETKLKEDQWATVYPVKTRIAEKEIVAGLETYITNPHAVLVTEYGEIDIELLFDVAPLTVLNFMELVRDGYYEGLLFHRVIPNFVAQGGDPRGDGWGGPGYSIRCEYSDEPYIRGSLGMATSGKDTGGSQFFICYTALPHLEARYTLFGRVVSGMNLVDRIKKGDVIMAIRIREGHTS